MPLYMLLMLFAGTSYGITSPILRIAYDRGMDVSTATDVQYMFAFVVLWLVALFRHKGNPIRGRQWLLIVATAVVNAAVSYFYYRALTVLPASLGIIFLFQFAWMTTGIDILVKRKLPTWPKWIGLLVILVGTFLSVGVKVADWSHVPFWAAGLGLLAALSYALTLYLSEFNDPTVSPELRSALVISIAMLVIFIPFPPGAAFRHIAENPYLTLYYGGWVALTSQVLPTLLLLIAIPRIGGRMAGILGTIELPTTVFAAWLMNGDPVSLSRWIGVLLILAGILVSEVIQTRQKLPDNILR